MKYIRVTESLKTVFNEAKVGDKVRLRDVILMEANVDDVPKRRRFTVNKYYQDVSVDRAKGRWLPSLRGTWLPSVDKQFYGGIAVNWLWVRVRVDWT